MLAACLALAAAFGGMVGALAAYGFVRPQPAPVIAAGKFGSEELQALKENVVQARVDLAALKASIDAGNRIATTQFPKIAERIERMERNAAEPVAKINKAVENSNVWRAPKERLRPRMCRLDQPAAARRRQIRCGRRMGAARCPSRHGVH